MVTLIRYDFMFMLLCSKNINSLIYFHVVALLDLILNYKNYASCFFPALDMSNYFLI